VRVLRLGHQRDLAAEALNADARGQLGEQDFDNDEAAELGLLRNEDPGHPAPAEFALERAVVAPLISRHTLIHWWQRATVAANVALPARCGWHALRPQWTTDLKLLLPLKDLAYAGGWKTTRTVADIYQQPDDDTMRSALTRRQAIDAIAPAAESTPPIHITRASA
jgi:hypothetical protein